MRMHRFLLAGLARVFKHPHFAVIQYLLEGLRSSLHRSCASAGIAPNMNAKASNQRMDVDFIELLLFMIVADGGCNAEFILDTYSWRYCQGKLVRSRMLIVRDAEQIRPERSRRDNYQVDGAVES